MAVLAALESQGVHIPPGAFPMQLLHRDAEFREALPVNDLDLLHDKARVRLEQTPAEAFLEADTATTALMSMQQQQMDAEMESSSVSPVAEQQSPLQGFGGASTPAGAGHGAGQSVDGQMSPTVDREIASLQATLREANERASETATLQAKVDALSDSLAAEGVERERLVRSAQDAELKAHHFEARASTLQQVLTTLASNPGD